MSEYVRKQALVQEISGKIDWLIGRSEDYRSCGHENKAREFSKVNAFATAISEFASLRGRIQSGAFDAPDGEVQRLRAENERYRKALERIAETDIPYAPMTDHSVIRFYEQVAREALASTPTEPSGAELVKCVICKTVAYPNGRWKKAHYGDVCPDCRSGRRIKAP